MKRIISLIAIITIALSTVSGLFAQTKELDHQGRKKIDKPKKRNPTATVGDNEFGPIRASSSGQGVLIEWEMVREKGNMGFKVFRLDSGERVQVNEGLILGSAAKAGRFPLYAEQYSFFDAAGRLGSGYVIESIDLDGASVLSSAFSSTFSTSVSQPMQSDDTGDPEASRQEADMLNLPTEVLTAIGPQTLESDPTMHAQVLSHPGVRINVKKEGIYRVTDDQLVAAGFDTGSDPNNWQLYLKGVEQAITIGPGADYIEFYGKGVDTVESDIQGYFLIVGDGAGKRIQNTIARPSIGTSTLRSYDQTFTKRETKHYLNGIQNGPADNFFGDPFFNTGKNVTFSVTGIDYSDLQSSIDVKLNGFSLGSHAVEVRLNGQLLGTVFGSSQNQFGGVLTFATSLLTDESLGHPANVLNVKATAAGDSNLFHTVSVNFNRKHAATNNTLGAYTLKSKATNVTGFATASTRIFDTSVPDDPKLITNIAFQQQGGTFGATIPAGRAMKFFAVEDSAIMEPLSITPSDGELLGVSTQSADLIIIAYKDFMTEAQAWATYRMSQGVGVKVINVDEIFNEFNYGVLSSDSIEEFLNYAYNNWGTPTTRPKYVLLVGDASCDSRNYLGLGFFNFVPTRIVTTVFSETGSDESLTDFNNDGLAEMPIGRIPARVPATVATALAKVENWEEGLATTNTLANRGALFAFDVPKDYPFRVMSEGFAGQLPVGVTSTMVPRGLLPPNNEMTLDPAAQSNLIAALNSPTGKFMVNYAGHGALYTWANNSYFSNENVPALMNENKESVFTLLTCLNGYFLDQWPTPSIAELLLDHPGGGAVAVWASSGETTADHQEVMALRFFGKVGLEEPGLQRIGDLISDAKAQVVGGEDVRLSWALLGDPMLKMWE